MNAFKKTLVSFALVAVSSTAFAAATRSYEEVKAAIDNTIATVEEAKASVDKGAASQDVVKLIIKARQSQKDIVNNALDLKRQQAGNVLNEAREKLESNNMSAAKESLADAVNRYKDIRQLYAASHD